MLSPGDLVEVKPGSTYNTVWASSEGNRGCMKNREIGIVLENRYDVWFQVRTETVIGWFSDENVVKL